MKTKKEMFAEIASLLSDNEEVVAFCEKNIEVLSRKRAKSDKPSKRQIENEGIKSEIAGVLSDEGKTVTEIVKALDNAYTSQKVSALLRQMDGVTKEVVKGKSLFTIA